MTFDITAKTQQALAGVNVQPSLVLEIDGVDEIFGAVEVLRLIRIGDPDLEIGNAWKIGGTTPIEDQEDIVSIESGSGTQISQQLYPDKGSVSSVSSVQLALVDRGLVVTRLISPGVVVDDILGRKATLWIGFKGTAYKEDFIPIFSGIIDEAEAGPGLVKLNIAHPEQLKRQEIFVPIDVNLAEELDSVETAIDLDDASNLLDAVTGPDGTEDTGLSGAINFYIQVEDEIIQYTGITGNQLTGCVRGALGTVAATHAFDDDGNLPGKSLVKLEGPAIELALKIMLSGVNGPYVEDLAVKRYLHPNPLITVENSIFFEGVNLNRDYGVSIGDFVTTTGATNGANNVSAKPVTEIVVTEDGSYAVIDDVTFVEESDTAAVASFRSQFDTLGEGLGLKPDQVDVDEHIFWNNFQLASLSYRFILTDKINGKDFLDKEVYMPIGAYSLPRQGRASMGYHVGSVVRGTLKVLNRHNIKDPDKIRQRRTINRNFYNTIIYKFDKHPITGKFSSGAIVTSADSRAQIPVGTKAFTVESAGIRRNLSGAALAASIAGRYLIRYQLAAEFYEDIGVLFKDGYNLEPGDVVLFDPTGLKIPNLMDGTRTKPPKIFTVINKKIDLKTGDCRLSLVDANFDQNERYGSISPSSLIVSGTETELVIEDSYGELFPGHESLKWEDYLGLPIIVHSPDWSFEEEVILLSIDPANRYKLNLDPSTPLSVPPTAGFIIDIANYPTGTDPNTNALYKAAHAHLSQTVEIATGVSATQFTVAPGDVGSFQVGKYVRVHDADFGNDSGELRVTDVTGVTVTVESTMGFTPDNTMVAESLPFADGQASYRIF